MKDRKLRIGILVVVMAVALIVPMAEAAEKMQYRLKFDKGKKYYTKSVVKQQITQTIMGQEQKIDMTIGFGFNFDIEDVDDSGNAWVRYTYEWIKFEQKGPMGEVVYDSSKKKSPVSPAGQSFAMLLGETFSMKMTPQGQVKEIKGLDEMYSNIQKKLPEGPMGEQIMQAFGATCSANLKNLYLGWLGYAGDHDDLLVGAHTQSKDGSYPFEYMRYSWVEYPQDENGNSVTLSGNISLEDKLRGIENGLLFPYIGDTKAYHCHANRRYKSNGAFRSYSISCSMNGKWDGYSSTPNYIPYERYNQIKRPATKYVFLEEPDPRGWNRDGWVLQPEGDSWMDAVAAWHDKKCALAFADGHVEMHKWEDNRTLQLAGEGSWGDAERNQPDNPDLKYMQKGYATK